MRLPALASIALVACGGGSAPIPTAPADKVPAAPSTAARCAMQRAGRTQAWCCGRNLNRGRHFSAGAALAPARRIAGSYSIIRRCRSAPLFRPERQQDVFADAGDAAELELAPFV